MSADLAWPFFDDAHRAYVPALQSWLDATTVLDDERDADGSCRAWVRELAAGGWLKACVDLDVRRLCLTRETLAYRSALGDFPKALCLSLCSPVM